MRARAALCGLAAAWLASLPAQALYVRIDGDRLTLRADNVPLRTVLGEFARAGVAVKADPSINPRITASLTDRDLQRALDELLAPNSFVLQWDVFPGPVRDIPRLTELQLFEPGGKARMTLLVPEATARVLRMPGEHGAEYFADELLVAAKAGTSVEAFLKAVASIGGTVVASAPALGIYRVQLQPGTDVAWAVAQLKQLPVVDGAEPNYVTRLPRAEKSALSFDASMQVPKLARGTGAPLAVLDSGLLAQPALGDIVAGQYDATEPGRAMSDPDGHGTQMALIASGAIEPEGVAREGETGVPLLAVRAFDEEGRTSNFSLLRAIEFSLKNGARVMSLSWGSETDSDFLRNAIGYAMNQGLIVVAAVGNEPTGRAVYPAAYPGVIGVAALQADGSRWPQSNYGAMVDVAAPGVASFPVGHDGPPGGYAGTSIATAYVAKQVASYLAAHPGTTADQAKAALGAALRDAGDAGRDAYFGAGVLDAAAAARFQAR